jgi:hypothetical protein
MDFLKSFKKIYQNTRPECDWGLALRWHRVFCVCMTTYISYLLIVFYHLTVCSLIWRQPLDIPGYTAFMILALPLSIFCQTRQQQADHKQQIIWKSLAGDVVEPCEGQMRYLVNTNTIEVYAAGRWNQV